MIEITEQEWVDALNAQAPLTLQLVAADGTPLWGSPALPPLVVGGSICFKLVTGYGDIADRAARW